MIKTLHCPETSGNIKIINSKSEAHRMLICAALADKKTEIHCESINEDISATANCLKALGAEIAYTNGTFTVEPIREINDNAALPCNESGSTLRFLLPFVSAQNGSFRFITKGRLAQRPLSPLKEELTDGGCSISADEQVISVSGKCAKNRFSIAGNVSSQFISGLMFMLTLSGGEIEITGNTESLPYIEMTAQALQQFGCDIKINDNIITVPKTNPLISPEEIQINGDWSNAAFFITAGVIGKKPISVSGLDINSKQGDKAIVDILKKAGADIRISGNTVTAYPSELTGTEICAKNIPDLVPVLSVAATKCKGQTKISGCARLRLKESDRIETVKEMISSLGGDIDADNDTVTINGKTLSGGTVNSHNDHRIAMSAAVAAFSCSEKITVLEAEAVKKSYPSFWDEIKEG